MTEMFTNEFMIFGMNVFYSMAMDKPEFVMRTWKERLFTRPWKPLQKTKTIHHPYMAIINGCLYAHPSLREQVKNLQRKNRNDLYIS